MKSYREIYESVDINGIPQETQAFMDELEQTIMKHFPDGYFQIRLSKNLGTSIVFRFGVDTQWSNGIWENDLSPTSVMIRGMSKEGVLGEKIQAEALQGGSVRVQPDEGSYMAFGSVKVGLRKKTGTPKQIIKHFDSYFKKLRKTVEDVVKEGRVKDEHIPSWMK